jgi:hypothetical protein
MNLIQAYIDAHPPNPFKPLETELNDLQVHFSKIMMELRLKIRIVTEEYIPHIKNQMDEKLKSLGYERFIKIDYNYDARGNLKAGISFAVDDEERLIPWS